jgi:hypothetical protein
MQTSSLVDSTVSRELSLLRSALDTYELACSRLLAEPAKMEAYLDASAAMATVRGRGVPIPALTVPTLQLAIAHCELEFTLWKRGLGAASDEKLREAQGEHRAALDKLAQTASLLLMGAA